MFGLGSEVRGAVGLGSGDRVRVRGQRLGTYLLKCHKRLEGL